MSGAAKYIAFNGQRFGIANDTEPKVIFGGAYVEDVEAYGDGVHVPNKNIVPGKINDIQVRLQAVSSDHERLDELSKLDNVSCVYKSADQTYQAVGSIVAGADGLIKNTRMDKSEVFQFIVTIGKINVL